MTKKLVLVDCISQFRIRYVVEVEDDIDHALDEVVCESNSESFKEFSQKHLDQTIVSHREITSDEYLKIFDQDNDYLISWPADKKLEYINKIDYSK